MIKNSFLAEPLKSINENISLKHVYEMITLCLLIRIEVNTKFFRVSCNL